jgi:outer membrane protein OmpA-like peptidoglycan-associated protein
MKPNIFISAACVLAACGCAGPLPFGSAARSPESEQVVVPGPASPAVAPQAKVAPPEPVRKPAEPAPDGHPAPDAVIKLNPGSDRLSGEMEARLARIAQQARENEQLMLRLESYVPDGGSHALNLGLAEQALQVIRKRLVELSVSPRRIFLAPFGEEHREERDRRMHWVEIYLVRPRL